MRVDRARRLVAPPPARPRTTAGPHACVCRRGRAHTRDAASRRVGGGAAADVGRRLLRGPLAVTARRRQDGDPRTHARCRRSSTRGDDANAAATRRRRGRRRGEARRRRWLSTAGGVTRPLGGADGEDKTSRDGEDDDALCETPLSGGVDGQDKTRQGEDDDDAAEGATRGGAGGGDETRQDETTTAAAATHCVRRQSAVRTEKPMMGNSCRSSPRQPLSFHGASLGSLGQRGYCGGRAVIRRRRRRR